MIKIIILVRKKTRDIQVETVYNYYQFRVIRYLVRLNCPIICEQHIPLIQVVLLKYLQVQYTKIVLRLKEFAS